MSVRTRAGEGGLQLCALRVGEQEFALDLMRVEEVLRPLPVTAVPGAPGVVEGVVEVRGVLIPVVNLRRCLGLKPAEQPTRTERLMICLIGRRRFALRVDAALEVMRVERAALRPAPPLRDGTERPFVLGAVGPPSRLRLLLDLKVLLRDRREVN
ncbi:MAG TPA: chemotaxis protein CheW [Myxococcaceae bacterium]|nr:chemotaxis protein CheW [Myxococcaceae bacterium]